MDNNILEYDKWYDEWKREFDKGISSLNKKYSEYFKGRVSPVNSAKEEDITDHYHTTYSINDGSKLYINNFDLPGFIRKDLENIYSIYIDKANIACDK